MATRSSILAWKIPWMEESGGLQSMGLQKSQTPLSDKTTKDEHENLKNEFKQRKTNDKR